MTTNYILSPIDAGKALSERGVNRGSPRDLHLSPRKGTEGGQDLAEYALLIALIALVVIGAVTLFGNQVTALFEAIVADFPGLP